MKTITIAKGDGIGPEIMEATLRVLSATGAKISYEEIEIGEKSYLNGHSSGIPQEAWNTIRLNKVLLKAPITTPQGGGYKSLNVTMRKALGLYANIRPCSSLYPFIFTKHPKMDVVIVRENEEDLYAGIEHQQTQDVVQCLKLMSRPGCEKIIRYAFEYARHFQRRKVTCFSKDNIMKQTDGLFHQIFKEVSKEYQDIESEHFIVDIGAALLADKPEIFDVIVMPNLYGDILSDIAAQLTGSVGLAGSANIGESCAMFEAIHGSAPSLAGKNQANPSGLLMGALQMLNYIGENQAAELIHNAWLFTLEKGIHTPDIFHQDTSKQMVGTKELADAIIQHLGENPNRFPRKSYGNNKPFKLPQLKENVQAHKELWGVDVFVDDKAKIPQEVAQRLQAMELPDLSLQMITNRGVMVWPNGFEETFCTNHWRCRFLPRSRKKVEKEDILILLQNALINNVDVIKTENLYAFDGKPAFSLGQGQ
ncbi:NADP-dependent isocitrate dehydrogenase [Pleomorphovibrio marinus]|uniref:NADP-dependent isocitrate dehydrogenase n=1 Tax=Pleomorphovibrio marinus TaxID=2164132 RepID=UPI000E0B1E50|nr:NADP-dependent isocitrate dehydrogenase [Pleomorphovibrio marinus]